MCAISGFITYNGQKADPDKLNTMFQRCVDRGRDSFGVVGRLKDGTVIKHKVLGKYDGLPVDFQEKLLTQESIVIANHRAEPTTEYVEHKSLEDAQPFSGESEQVFIAHNGTIANDKELAKRFEIGAGKSKIDTYIYTQVIDKLHLDPGITTNALRLAEFTSDEIKGSMAIVGIIYDELMLLSNYKPIYINYQPEGIYFASLPQYIRFSDIPSRDNIQKMKPYSYTSLKLGEVTEETVIKFHPMLKEPNQKALVVCSGGLDSVTSLKVAIDRFGKNNVTLLHFQYNCNAQGKEEESVRAVSKKLGCELILMPIDIFGGAITESPLLDGSGEFAEYDKGVEFAYEWVPARNTVMMALAIALAEAKGYGYIYLGNNLEESGAYPDNEMEFIETLRRLIPNAVADGYSLEIMQPVGNLMKHEIVQLGLDVKAPLELTWSCYKNGDKHCGVCGPCRMRKVAFEMAGREEVIEYEN